MEEIKLQFNIFPSQIYKNYNEFINDFKLVAGQQKKIYMNISSDNPRHNCVTIDK
jgi:hypothetical protein